MGPAFGWGPLPSHTPLSRAKFKSLESATALSGAMGDGD